MRAEAGRGRRAVRGAITLVACVASLAVRAATFPLPPGGDDIVGESVGVIAREDDTLLDLARRHDLGYGEIVAANPDIDPWVPPPGAVVLVPTRFILPEGVREGIVINLAQMRLYYFPAADPSGRRVVITHPLGVGREGESTPVGVTKVVRKLRSPAWFPPDDLRRRHAEAGSPLPREVPPGPDNPLGTHALYLGMPGILVHGTNRPWGIGMRVSSGCIRLYPEDIASLFGEVPVGTPVRIVNEPFVIGRHEGRLHVEVHPSLGDDALAARAGLAALIRAVALATRDDERIDWDAVATAADEHRGVPVQVSWPKP